MEILRIEKVGKLFDKKEVLKDVSFYVEKGSIVSLVGKNGAGKTTTIRIILGFLKPSRGSIVLNSRRISYVQEIPHFHPFLKAREALEITKEIFSVEKFEDKLDFLMKKVDFESSLLEKRIQFFSPGEKKKLALIQAFLIEADFTILDDPFTFLDPTGIKGIRDLILTNNREGRTFLISSHLLKEVEELSDYVVFIHEGKTLAQEKWNKSKGLEGRFFRVIKGA